MQFETTRETPGTGGYRMVRPVPMRRWRDTILPLALAIALPAAVMAVLVGIAPRGGGHESGETLLLLSIVLVAYLGGVWPGLLATVVSAALGVFVILVPAWRFAVDSAVQSTELAAVVAMGVIVTLLIERLRRSRARAIRARLATEVILTSIADGVVTTDLGGRVVYLNEVAGRLTGWTMTEAKGRPIGDVMTLVTPDARQPVVVPAQRVLDYAEPADIPRGTLLVARDGRETPIADTTAPIFARDGSLLGVSMVFRDVTGELLAERALLDRLQMREELARVVQTAPGVLYSFRLRPDGTMHVPYASPGIREIFQLDPADLAVSAEAIFAMLPPEDIGAFRESIAESARAMSMWHAEFRLRRADGTVAWVEGRSVPSAEPDGAITWNGYINDITDRKRAETERAAAVAALERSERQHRDLVEMSPDAIFVTRGPTIEYANPAGIALLGGTSPNDAVGHSSEEFARPDEVPALYAADARLHRGEHIPPGVWHLRRRDGTETEVEVVARAFRDADGPATQTMMRDLTDRRRLEAQVREAQKLESVGLLAGGVAHDFNNWLTVIGANGDILRDLVKDNATALELVDEIRNAGDRATSLTRQLLAFSRRQVLTPRVLDLNTTVADTERMLRRLMGEDIAVQVTLRATRRVTADAGHLTQVLMNLAVNARDAMPAGGTLRIDTADVDIIRGEPSSFAARPGPYVSVSVGDTGTGMSREVAARIFEPFFTTKGVGKGTGLGLSVVHGIVRQSGGDIVVVSAPGVGSTFTAILPATDAAVSEGHDATTPASLRGTEAILLVEDEVLVRRSAARALRTAGYSVRESASGEEAARLAGDPRIALDLLVTDVVMPGIGGAVLADWVHASRPALKVLFTSGYTDDAVLRHGVQQEDVAFLPKPYDVRSLLAKVRETLDVGTIAA